MVQNQNTAMIIPLITTGMFQLMLKDLLENQELAIYLKTPYSKCLPVGLEMSLMELSKKNNLFSVLIVIN